ncbi:MAG: caspase family protein [Cyclobacteriaceae bacterium]|jgi:hypothetical protein|nr:caspase family protein [Cyclobacteriaceae bacterium]
MKRIIIALLILISWQCYGQNFSEKTNEVVLNFKNQNQPTTSFPVITWETPRIDETFSQANDLNIEFLVSSEVPLKNLKIILGDGTSTIKEKKIDMEAGILTKKVTQHISLLDGRNLIEIQVENIKGGIVSSTRMVLVGKDAIASAIDVNRSDYALIFATNNYDDLNNLTNPIFDSKTIEELLRTRYGFKTEIITDATHDEILEKISEYNTRKFNPQDQLLVFFAGHGVFDDNLNEGFVAARDSKSNDKGRATYIPHSILRARIDNIKCEHIFLAMDVCFGGTLDPEFSKQRSVYDAASDTDLLLRKLSLHTRKFLTSGSKEYVPDGVAGSHSPFASLFIQALNETGGKGGRIFTLLDLYPYFQRLQTSPRYGSFSVKDEPTSDFVFVVSQN